MKNGLFLMLGGFVFWYWMLSTVEITTHLQWTASVAFLYLCVGPGIQVLIDTLTNPSNRPPRHGKSSRPEPWPPQTELAAPPSAHPRSKPHQKDPL